MPIAGYAHDREDVAARIESALGNLGPIEGAAYFGSTATGLVDRYSDIDLVVGCSPEQAVSFVRRLHESLELALYHPFADREPSGRYWFDSTNPMLRLDLSFHPADEYRRVLQNQLPPLTSPFLTIPVEPRPEVTQCVSSAPHVSSVDQRFAGVLREFQDALKATARGRTPKRPLHVCWETIEAMECSPRALRIYERCFDEFERGVREGEF